MKRNVSQGFIMSRKPAQSFDDNVAEFLRNISTTMQMLYGWMHMESAGFQPINKIDNDFPKCLYFQLLGAATMQFL